MVMMFGAGIGVGALGNTLVNAASDSPVKVENLLRSELEVVEGIEVIMSRVEIAAGTSLPRHHHPGEEFVYVIDGEATMWQAGKADTVLRAGDVFKVPLGQVHTAITGSQAATAIVFRVHRKGLPERIVE
jgi:quercetin dioxygenase-like cupin family protein